MAVNREKISALFCDNDRYGYAVNEKGLLLYANARFLSHWKQTDLKMDSSQNLSNYVKLEIQTTLEEFLSGQWDRVTVFQTFLSIENGKEEHQIATYRRTAIDGEIIIWATSHAIDELNENYAQAIMYREGMDSLLEEEEIIAASVQMQELLGMAKKVAAVDSAVLIKGESGVGKDVIAHYIHDRSKRKGKKMVEVNCASFPEGLLEAELFGYERGAFTGASQAGKRGLIEEADGGTLFLDEINSMPLSLQGKILRVMETKMIKPVGAVKSIYVDFRIITATNQDLLKAVQEGTFRADLYYRLNVIPISIPPLRQRQKDILPLAMFFLRKYCDKYHKIKSFSNQTCQAMIAYSWPGNVRELKNFVERVVVMCKGEWIEIQDFPELLTEYAQYETAGAKESFPLFVESKGGKVDVEDPQFSLTAYLEECEKDIIEKVLKKYGNTYKAAEILKMSQSTIARRKEKYHIQY